MVEGRVLRPAIRAVAAVSWSAFAQSAKAGPVSLRTFYNLERGHVVGWDLRHTISAFRASSSSSCASSSEP